MDYRREIDGLRTIAVVPVILFHAGVGLFRGGFVGVDIFFVISGYLITSILIADLEKGRFSILRFYERRARRILPALFVVLLACLPFAWAWMVPSELRDFGKSLVSVALFASNINFWREADYFEADAGENVLLHTWSLAVEEQYYVFFPVLLYLLWRLRRRAAFAVIVGLAVLSLLASEWGWRAAPNANFYLLPFRAWELFAGSICAFLLSGRAPWRNEALAGAGLGLVLVSIFLFTEATPFPSLYALVPVGGTALIILFATEGTRVGALLSLRPMVGIGLISYSAYLWHQPLLAFARVHSILEPPLLLMLGLSVLSLGLAWVSWRFIEQPFRTRRGAPALLSRGAVFAVSGGMLAVFIGLGGVVYATKGLPGRSVAALTQPLIDMDVERQKSYRLLRNAGLKAARRTAFLAPDGRAKVLVLGDSHGKDLFNAFELNKEAYGVMDFMSLNLDLTCMAGSAPDYAACPAHFAKANPQVFAAATHIVFSARWHKMKAPLEIIAAYLEAFGAAGKMVIVASNTVEYAPEAPDLIALVARAEGYGTGGAAFPRAKTDQLFYASRDLEVVDFNQALRAVVARYPGARFADKWSVLCDADAATCESVTDTGEAIYYDYGHWTLQGARHLGRLIAAQDWLSPGR